MTYPHEDEDLGVADAVFTLRHPDHRELRGTRALLHQVPHLERRDKSVIKVVRIFVVVVVPRARNVQFQCGMPFYWSVQTKHESTMDCYRGPLICISLHWRTPASCTCGFILGFYCATRTVLLRASQSISNYIRFVLLSRYLSPINSPFIYSPFQLIAELKLDLTYI